MSNVAADGSLRIDGFTLPPSAGWSDEARGVFLKRFAGPAVSVQSIAGQPGADEWLRSAQAFRAGMEQLHRRLLGSIERDHHCDVEESTVGGVRVQWVTPTAGVPPENAHRVLVNLHGGAFVGGAEYCGLVEALPVSHVGGFRICVVDYRQGWEHRFPAASEDVAAVVGELQRTYQPASIGVFGYSAGGMLTAQAVPWLLSQGIALPGALAICSAGAGGSGDSTYLANVAMGSPPTATGGKDSRAALGSITAPTVRVCGGGRSRQPPLGAHPFRPGHGPIPAHLGAHGHPVVRSERRSPHAPSFSPRAPPPSCTRGRGCGTALRTTTGCPKPRTHFGLSPASWIDTSPDRAGPGYAGRHRAVRFSSWASRCSWDWASCQPSIDGKSGSPAAPPSPIAPAR